MLSKNGFDDGQAVISKELYKLHFEDSIKWEELVLLKNIGEGKYGDVFKARYHDYPVACKIIKRKLNDKDAESMLEELKLMRRLKHPNGMSAYTCCLTSSGAVDGILY